MINFIKEYTDLFIFLCWLGTFVTGYFYGHHVGHSLGFTRGRIAGRKHPSLRNEQR